MSNQFGISSRPQTWIMPYELYEDVSCLFLCLFPVAVTQSPPYSVVRENAAMPINCAAPEIFLWTTKLCPTSHQCEGRVDNND